MLPTSTQKKRPWQSQTKISKQVTHSSPGASSGLLALLARLLAIVHASLANELRLVSVLIVLEHLVFAVLFAIAIVRVHLVLLHHHPIRVLVDEPVHAHPRDAIVLDHLEDVTARLHVLELVVLDVGINLLALDVVAQAHLDLEAESTHRGRW